MQGKLASRMLESEFTPQPIINASANRATISDQPCMLS